ncbi:GNAT family N-acetyltransferase [Ancylomarina sp. DW003]|nr:GNAT family protein [Ancylomarina sp. DW003]MDE5422478.1 GNAT family N-acetyltransferase [Ancylomarina sp. DW003]
MYLDGSETKRLLIRKLEVSDIPIWESFFENNPFLPFLGLDLSLDIKAQSKDWIERQLWRYENNKYGHHALIDKQTNKFIGQCGLLTQEIDNKIETEIGYHIIPEYWGKGYATEAARKFRDYAFENNLCNSLVSIIDVRNIVSQKVAEKNGMKRTKQLKYFNLDVYIYRIEREEYESI